MKALIATIVITTATNAFAFTYPDQAVLGSLVCTIFDSNGRYYCEDTTPIMPGQASNTLILEFDDLVKMNAKPVEENQNVYRSTSR